MEIEVGWRFVVCPMVEFSCAAVLSVLNVVLTAAFKSREDHRKQLELEEARKAGLAPAELDEDGKEINPHIPQYMSSAPWYLNAERPVSVVCSLFLFVLFYTNFFLGFLRA